MFEPYAPDLRCPLYINQHLGDVETLPKPDLTPSSPSVKTGRAMNRPGLLQGLGALLQGKSVSQI